MLIEDSIKTEFLDNAHFEIECAFSGSYASIGTLAVTGGSGLTPSLMKGTAMQTPEYTITCIVTVAQDLQLQKLFAATMRPGYIDMSGDNVVILRWGPGFSTSSGHAIAKHEKRCYLKEYTPPTQVSFDNAQILEVTLTLRPI